MRHEITWKDAAAIHNALQDARSAIGVAFSNGVSAEQEDVLLAITHDLLNSRDAMRRMLDDHPKAKRQAS